MQRFLVHHRLGAFVPPVAAVIFAGCQLSFWENATSFTGESFELLWFAVILWQLLEYRLDESAARLYFAAFLYGACFVQNWALLGFLPAFLMMLIWLRGLGFFQPAFSGPPRLVGSGGIPAGAVAGGPAGGKIFRRLFGGCLAGDQIRSANRLVGGRVDKPVANPSRPGLDGAHFPAAGLVDGDPLERLVLATTAGLARGWSLT